MGEKADRFSKIVDLAHLSRPAGEDPPEFALLICRDF